ncbi:MAG: hypothetical protein PHD26_06265 [Methanosarcinaceae archaeon]|nr:hypothetical protein [Methanosarcinaceae archaeon]
MLTKFTKFLIPVLLTSLILLAFFYFAHGLSLVHELKTEDVETVQITQGKESLTLKNDKDIEKAVLVVKVLAFRFGKANGGTPNASCTFYLREGSKIEIGANKDTLFKNGKQYLAVKDSCSFFENLIQGFFFSEPQKTQKLGNAT